VTEAETLANAAWMQEHLQPLGWDIVVVDFRWYDRLADGNRVQDPEGVMIDGFGRCVPAPNRFPSAANGAGFKPLADKLHALGLKFGIHIMRGIPRQAVAQNLPVAGSKFTAAQVAVPESDTNRTCVWNHDMFGVDAASDAARPGMPASPGNTPTGAWTISSATTSRTCFAGSITAAMRSRRCPPA